MKIARVRLNKDEAQWFGRNLRKSMELLEGAATKDPGVLERRSYKVLASMKDKYIPAETFEGEALDMNLTRKQKEVTAGIIQSVLIPLVGKAIPEYVSRGDEYKDYLENAKRKAELLRTMMRKFK